VGEPLATGTENTKRPKALSCAIFIACRRYSIQVPALDAKNCCAEGQAKWARVRGCTGKTC